MQLRNYSPRTVHSYIELLSKVECDLAFPLDSITNQQLKDYLHQRITNEKISVSLVNQTISAFKILQVDVLGREWEQFKIRRPRREKKLPVVLSTGEVERLIAVTQNIKHRAILALAYSAGLRRQETQMIKPADIDSARMLIRVVQGKGKKDRHTILSPKVLDLLRTYYKFQRPKTFLFESQGKKGVKLSDQTLNQIVKNSAAKAGIKKNVSFHTLRHCFATHLLEKGVNIRIIQEFMGACIPENNGPLHAPDQCSAFRYLISAGFHGHLKTLVMENKRQSIELADIFRACGEGFLHTHSLCPDQIKALHAIENCRTSALGGHTDQCNHCGYTKRSYNSCRNRHCPKCQFTKKLQWVDKLSSNLPPVRHFHVVFTVPDCLNAMFYLNQDKAYDLLFKAAGQALVQCAANPNLLGAQAGAVGVLHTWGQTLVYHPPYPHDRSLRWTLARPDGMGPLI